MTSDTPVIPERPSRKIVSAAKSAPPSAVIVTSPCLVGLKGGLLITGSLTAVVLIALLDYVTGPNFSCSIFYLLPVAACAWWGGFPHGILLAVAGSVAWHMIDVVENPTIPSGPGIWNGLVRFCTLTLISSLVSRLHSGVQRERRLARTDPLTGAANARTFFEEAEAAAERARREFKPLTLAYLDVDNFKQLNDRQGHAAGDDALCHIVETIHHNLSGPALLARLGGDEFALLLPDQDPEKIVTLLRHLQQLLSHEMARGGWPVTMSVGAITFLRPAWDVDLMIRQVDTLMYGAKKKGKSRVEHAVAHDDQQLLVGERRKAQRRATARVLCGRSARVRGEAQGEAREELATVFDISAGGVGLSLENSFPLETVLVIESLAPGSRTLLARVVRVTLDGGRWLHGCVLSKRLNAEELGGWLGHHDTQSDALEVPAESDTDARKDRRND